MKKLFLTLLILAWASVAWGADRNIYISSSAAAGGDGSIDTPFDAVTDLNWTTIAGYVSSGDDVYIYFKGGETFNTGPGPTFAFFNIQAASISVSSYGTGNGIIDATGYQKGVYANNRTGLNISNIEVKNATEDNIMLDTCTNAMITNVYVHDAAGGAANSRSGIYLYDGSNGCILDGVISRFNGGASDDSNTYAHGIYVNNSDTVLIKNSKLEYNGNRSGVDARGITFNASDGGTIQNSTIRYNGSTSDGSCVEGYTSANLSVLKNRMINYKDGAEIKNACGGLSFYGNYVYAENGSGLMYGDADSDGVGESENGKIYGNTILFGGAGGIEITSSTQDIRNNIIENIDSGFTYTVYFRRISLADIATITLDYNIYYQPNTNNIYLRDSVNGNNYTSISAWQAVVPSHDAHSVIIDPKVLSSGKLRIGSPCKSAGTSIAGVNDTGTDIWGNSSFRTNIGAYWGSGVIPGVLDIGNGKKGGVFRIGR